MGAARDGPAHPRLAGDRDGTQDRLGPLLDAIFVSPQANRDFQLVYLDLIEHSVREETFAELPAMTRGIIESLYTDVLQAGVDDGMFDIDDVEEAALLMRTVIDGTFLQWLQRPDWEAEHAAFKQRCHDTLQALLTRPQAERSAVRHRPPRAA